MSVTTRNLFSIMHTMLRAILSASSGRMIVSGKHAFCKDACLNIKGITFQLNVLSTSSMFISYHKKNMFISPLIDVPSIMY